VKSADSVPPSESRTADDEPHKELPTEREYVSSR